MNTLIIRSIKLIAASSGPALIVYAISLFEKYFALGKDEPDDIYRVLVNNHGSYKYITDSQNQNFLLFLYSGMGLLLILLITIAITKYKSK